MKKSKKPEVLANLLGLRKRYEYYNTLLRNKS